MRFILLLAVLISAQCAFAQKITGFVKDEKGNPLSFSSIYIKGTSKGTTANEKGRFALAVPAGQLTIVCQRIGYTIVEKTVTVSSDIEVNFELRAQELTMDGVIIKKNTGEDPAYAIIRKAIAKRNEYENEVNDIVQITKENQNECI